MAREVGGCHVAVQVVITNVTTKEKMEDAIEEIADTLLDYPWLGLGDAVERLIQAFEELEYIPD